MPYVCVTVHIRDDNDVFRARARRTMYMQDDGHHSIIDPFQNKKISQYQLLKLTAMSFEAIIGYSSFFLQVTALVGSH